MTPAAGAATRRPCRARLADQLYRLLMRAFPAELRNEFADDMVGMFRAQREAAAGDPLRRVRLWLLAIADVAVHAARERLDARRALRVTNDGEGVGVRLPTAAEAAASRSEGPQRSRHGSPSPTAPRRSAGAGTRALIDDVRYAVRVLARRPKFTALAALILAIGVGTSTTVFGIVDATLMRPLPYPHAERLMDLWIHMPEQGFTINGMQLDAVRAWREQRAIFEQVEGYDREGAVILGVGEPERHSTAAISPGLLRLLGASPRIGRGFTADDVAAGAAPVVLISETLWRQRFNAAPSVLGEELRLDDRSFTIVGVLPDSFHFPSEATVAWRPLPLAPHPEWGDKTTVNAVGLLQPDLTQPRLSLEAVHALTDSAAEDMQELLDYPYVRLQPFENLRASAETRSSLLLLLGAVGFLVLIAAANLANLLLAQTTTRGTEIGVRTALGAARGRVARQMLAESTLLALLGGALGTLVAAAMLRVTLTLVPASIVNRLAGDIGLDGRVAAFALAVSLGLGFAMGLVPAIACARTSWHSVMTGSRRTSASRGHARTRSLLLVAEVALSLLLLVGAGLLANSFARLHAIDPGFDPDNLLLVSLRFDPNRYATEGERVRVTEELDAMIEGLPGVLGSTVGADAPPVPGGVTFGIAPEAEGMPAAPIEDLVLPYGRVAPDYFAVVGIPLVAGGTFAAPGQSSGPSIIVNESLAAHYWGDVNPVGKRLRLEPEDEWLTVVGVAADVRSTMEIATLSAGRSFDGANGSMEIYYPFDPGEETPASRTLTVRTRDDPMALVEAIKGQVRSYDPDQPISFQRAGDMLASRVEVPRFYLQLISVFALIAAALAAFGLYGVLSYSVGQRVHEIGIRMALGASERGILKSVVLGGLLLATLGVALGLAGAAALSRYLESMLYGVSTLDPATFAGAAALMLLVSALACYLPALRATRVDPVEALRAE